MIRKFLHKKNITIFNYIKLRAFEKLNNTLNNQKILKFEQIEFNNLINKIKIWKKTNGYIYLSKHYYYNDIKNYSELKNDFYFFNFDLKFDIIKKPGWLCYYN